VTSRPIVLATRSHGKLRELRALLAESGLEVVDLETLGVAPLAEEDTLEVYETFEENAFAKARYFARRVGGAVMADDSGLSVDSLGGAPGVRSKRWSGRDDLAGQALDDANNARLLDALRHVPPESRTARYVCAAAYVADGLEHVARGEVTGRIVEPPRGAGGFGYDPYFESDELGVTFGEATMAEKAGVSHRARAFRRLLVELEGGRAMGGAARGTGGRVSGELGPDNR
jgi:XTP/dITP diphosphohydrolase